MNKCSHFTEDDGKRLCVLLKVSQSQREGQVWDLNPSLSDQAYFVRNVFPGVSLILIFLTEKMGF